MIFELHTHSATGLSARTLDTAAIPANLQARMVAAVLEAAPLIGAGLVRAADEGDADADRAPSTLDGLAAEAMARFGTPAEVTPQSLHRALAARASEPR